MKDFSKTWLLFILVHFVLSGCNNKESDKVEITIKSTTQPSAKVNLTYNYALDVVTISESQTDSLGNCSFELTMQKPMFARIQIGEKYGEVYLSPGYDLVIEEVGQDYQISLKFSGVGAEINNYISWVNSNAERIKWVNGTDINLLDYNEFFHRFDSLKTTIDEFHKSYIDSVALSKEAASMLEYKNKVKYSLYVQIYKFYKLNNTLNEKWEAQKEGRDYVEANVPGEFEKLSNEIPFDPGLLTDGSGDYQLLLNMYWHNKVNLPVSEDLLHSGIEECMAPLMANGKIQEGDYPEAIREFLLAFNFRYWLADKGITPETDSVFTDFKKTYQNSIYLPVLNKGYNEWLAIAPGNPAPDLEGYTREGKKVSIKDLKGKGVYIDAWATWCAPCIGEIPASKKIQQEFAIEESIQFLNVSVDEDKSDWENFLNDDKSWGGLHIILEPEKIDSFYATYKLFGVPGFILIDQSGNIVNMKAPRPSDEKLSMEIKKLLEKEI